MIVGISHFYTRLNNWLDSPAMQPFRRFGLWSVCLYMLVLIFLLGYGLINGSSIDSTISFFKECYLFILMIPIYPFVGLFFYFVALCNLSHPILFYLYDPAGNYFVDIPPLLSVPPLVVYPFVLYARQKRYIRHLVYIIPVLVSLLGIWFLMNPYGRGAG